MRPIQHASNNAVVGAPIGCDQAATRVLPLPVTHVQFADGGPPAVESYWQPTEAERAAIAAGASICLSIWGNTMPPTSIRVDGLPFEDC